MKVAPLGGLQRRLGERLRFHQQPLTRLLGEARLGVQGPATRKNGFWGGGCPSPNAVWAAVVDFPRELVTVNVPAPRATTVKVPLSGFRVLSPGFAMPVTVMGIPRKIGTPEISE